MIVEALPEASWILEDLVGFSVLDSQDIAARLGPDRFALFDSQGRQVWTRDLDRTHRWSARIVAAGPCLFALREGEALAIDSASGVISSRFATGDLYMDRFDAAGDALYAVEDYEQRRYVSAYRADGTAPQWRAPLESAPFGEVVATEEGIAVRQRMGVEIALFDRMTGDIRWTIDVGELGAHREVATGLEREGVIMGTPLDLAGRIVLAVRRGHVISVDAETGTVEWTAEVPIANPTSMIATSDGDLCVIDGSYFVRLRAKDGAILQRNEISSSMRAAGADLPAVLVSMNRSIIACDKMGRRLVEIDADSGNPKRAWEIPYVLDGSHDPRTSAGRLLLVDQSGALRAHAL